MYKKFNPVESLRLVRDYITGMTDPACDYLPYWLILPNKKPAEAAHCRVDDAELVGSWYEGLSKAIEITGCGEDTKKVAEGLRRHLMKSWGEHGLRFCEKYPWTHTVHSSFHEMGYILPAMNLITELHPDDELAEKRTSELIRGMRDLAIVRRVRTFWSGDSVEENPIYEFPNDVYLKEGGFDLTRHTGRGEQAIRNAVMLTALVRRYELKGDEVALDLAQGLANYVLGPSRYFSYDNQFFGHVHSAVWFAEGLVKLGRLTKNENYITRGKGIYDFVRTMTSSFGWLPEYARWHPLSEEHCETCCIRDMIMCARELIFAGFDEYWDDINHFARNQLVENQLTYTGFIEFDNSLPDGNGISYHDMAARCMGGFTGGSEPNSMSLTRFRSIAGCCVGTAPVALNAVVKSAIYPDGDTLVCNIPFDYETNELIMRSYIPDEGKIELEAKTNCKAGFRIYACYKDAVLYKNGEKIEFTDKIASAELKEGDTLTLEFNIETVAVKERVADRDYTVFYRGPDVVDITPRGEHIRLYQRDLSKPGYYPLPEDVAYTGAANIGPTQQAFNKK